jgi:putative ABC transport system substrate-binding protein
VNRRMFIGNTMGALILFPRALHAQSSTRVFRLGYIGLTAREADAAAPAPPGPAPWDAFRDEMRGLGYVAGQNYVLERRYLEGRDERIPQLVSELLDSRVDVLITSRTPAALAAKEATKTVPIVVAGVSNPERTGLVESLSRPGGNLTGVSNMFAETEGKVVELFKEALPNRSRLGVIKADSFENPELMSAARTLRVTLIHKAVPTPADLGLALAALLRQQVEALYAGQSTLAHRVKVGEFAIANRLPLFTRSREWPSALLAHGVNWPDIYRLVARHVAQILNGVKPSELPIQQPTKFYMLINLKVAKALGITLPGSLLIRADEVIE